MEKSNVNQSALSAQVATFDHPIKTADESPDLHQELTTECARPNPDGQSEEPLPSDEHSKGFMPSSEHSVRSIPSQNTEKHTLTSQDDIRKNAIDQIRPMLPTQKSIIVTISNQIAIPLISPNVYLTYGKVFGLFPFKVDTGEMCCLAVNQTPGLPRGVGGCIVFQLAVDTNDKYLCVYAFDPVIGNGSFGFKWKSEIKDYKSLVMKMEEEKWDNDHSTAQRSVKSDATGYVISGTMSHDDPIHLCVEVTNSHLKESFGQNFPEDFDGTLDCISIAITCAFNRQGTLLAVGCNDGRIVIWDFLTRGIAKIVSAHVHPVCSLSWSRNGHKLLSAATDNTVSIWDIVQAECDRTFRFPSPILKVQFHPRNSKLFLVCPLKHPAVRMEINGSFSVIPLDDDSDLNIVASFDRRGKHIYTGNARGRILVFSSKDLEQKASFRVTTGTLNTTAIKSIEFARRGECFLVNSADRIIRVYESGEIMACGREGEPEPIQKLQDLVNKTLWKKCSFSGDGEYIVAGSARQHSLYIWEKSIGNLVKILHGTKGELLLDVVWHPVRPIIASISSGLVSIWAQNQVENWSAFAPDFKELDENVEYEERESEFDIEDEDKEKEETKGPEEEDSEVDVTTIEPIQAFVSSDEDEEDTDALLYLPVSPEIEEPEESAWQLPIEAQQQQQGQEESQNEKKRPAQQIDNTPSPKKKRVKISDIDLPDAPIDEIHPLLNVKKPNEKAQKKTSRPKQPKSKSDKTKHRSKYDDA